MIKSMMKELFGGKQVKVDVAWQLASGQEAVLLDVRTRTEWKQGHVPGAMHISLESLQTQMGRLPRDRQILAICRSGSRSVQAVGLLRAEGLDALNVRGGMIAWNRAGLPTSLR